jgi:hypothetical protein
MKDLVQQSTLGSTRLAASSQELAAQADALQETVARFQLDGTARVTPMPVAFVPRQKVSA